MSELSREKIMDWLNNSIETMRKIINNSRKTNDEHNIGYWEGAWTNLKIFRENLQQGEFDA